MAELNSCLQMTESSISRIECLPLRLSPTVSPFEGAVVVFDGPDGPDDNIRRIENA